MKPEAVSGTLGHFKMINYLLKISFKLWDVDQRRDYSIVRNLILTSGIGHITMCVKRLFQFSTPCILADYFMIDDVGLDRVLSSLSLPIFRYISPQKSYLEPNVLNA